MKKTDAALAISLHAPTDVLRNQLVPINQKFPIKSLLEACRAYLQAGDERRHITFEYTLIKGVNDSDEMAFKLGKLLRGIRSKINLIPYNPHDFATYETSEEERMDAFAQRLMHMGYTVTLRRSRGDRIKAACGQLSGRRHRESKKPITSSRSP